MSNEQDRHFRSMRQGPQQIFKSDEDYYEEEIQKLREAAARLGKEEK